METPASIARSLVLSIQEALNVFAAQGKRADKARELADATQVQLKRLLESRPAGVPPDTAPFLQSIRRNHAPEQLHEEHRADAELRVRWETAFCDISLALMRLYAHPAAHRRAEEVAAVIRDIRLLQVEDIDVTPPEFPDFSQPGNTTSADENADPPGATCQDRKRQILRQMLEITRPHRDDMRDAYADRIEQTRHWLTLARELATALELELTYEPGKPE